MLTVDFDRFAVRPGDRVLDLGTGAGRHAFELYRRGAVVVALDSGVAEVAEVATMFEAMRAGGQAPPGARAGAVGGNAVALPFADGVFDHAVAAEVLEHIRPDEQAVAELARVVRPGGSVVVSVPRWWPERVCWALSEAYHAHEGGHVRIYRAGELLRKLRRTGLVPVDRHHAHALHAPYWWLKCLVGPDRDGHPLAVGYHRLLVWDIVRRPRATRVAERALAPVLGKSLVLYLRKPAAR